MTHLDLLAQLYLAFKSDDWDYAQQLQREYPELAAEVYGMVLRAESEIEFNKLVDDLTK
jgi:hypothetical protein